MEDQIEEEIKEERRDALMQLQQEIVFERTENMIGKVLEVSVRLAMIKIANAIHFPNSPPRSVSINTTKNGIIHTLSGFRLIASDNGVVIAANYWGKIKTTCQMIMIILLIAQIQNPFFQQLEQISIYLALILTVISLIDYLIKNKKVLSEGGKK